MPIRHASVCRLTTTLLIAACVVSSARESDPQSRTVRLLAVGDAPPFRQEIRDGVRYELDPPPGSIPPRNVVIARGTDDSGEAPAPARITLGRVTDAVEIPGGIPLRVLTAPGDEGDPPSSPWFEIENPPDSGNLMIVIWRSPDNGGWSRPQAAIVPETAAGHVRFVNVSPWPAGLEISGERILVAPGRSHVRKLDPATDVPFTMSLPSADGTTTPIHQGTLMIAPDERAVVVLHRTDGEAPRRPARVIVRREPAGQ